MAKGDELLRYLRSIDAKLDRLNKQLEDFLSAPKRKRAPRRKVLWARTPEEAEELRKENPDAEIMRVLVAGTKEHAEKLRKENPDAEIIITGVPHPNEP